MTDNPLFQLLLIAAALYVAKLYLDDLRAARGGTPNPNALPGAVPARTAAIWIGIVGGLVLVTVETIGEIKLGVS